MRKWFKTLFMSQKEREHQYLAESKDLTDLERRLKILEQNGYRF